MNEIQFQQQAAQFLNQLFLQLQNQSIVLEDHWDIDHLCFRVSNEENYQQMKTDFSNFAELLIESEVGGRFISTFKMIKPVEYKNWSIQVVELPAPKKGKITVEGFEHIEIVSDLTFDEIRATYPKSHFDSSGLAKDFNQELEIELDGCAIKFHSLSLESVVRLESNSIVFNALKNSQVLPVLKNYSPLVAGTYPLGISMDHSDLDIVICANDFNKVSEIFRLNFKSYQDFKIEKIQVQGQLSMICQFCYEQVPFEIFVQNIPSVQQTAYSHFLIEEKLLKLGGKLFLEKVKSLRQTGLKTEPAFAKALNLIGDPYQELLNLQKKSMIDLQKLFNEKPV